MKVLQVHVKQLKKAYDINGVICTFHYRKKYTETEDIHNAARQFMGHIKTKKENTVTDKQFAKSLETAFQGLDGILRIKFEFD